MNRLRLLVVTSSLFATTSAGCDDKNQCIADCDSVSDTAGPTDTAMGSSNTADPSDTATGSSDTGVDPAAMECADSIALAAAFIESNRACTSSLDCVQVSAACFFDDAPCGSAAISADADINAWEEISEGLQNCQQCGAPDCASATMCTDDGQCRASQFDADYCPSIVRDVDAFILENRACQSDADCVSVYSGCYAGPLEQACLSVGLNAQANTDDWERLLVAYDECQIDVCEGAGECGSRVTCSPAGECIAEFP